MADSARGKPSKAKERLAASLKACRIEATAPAGPEDLPSYSFASTEPEEKIKKEKITKVGTPRVSHKQGERAASARASAVDSLSTLLEKEKLEQVKDLAISMSVLHLVRNQINSDWAPKEAFRAKLFTCQVLTLGDKVVKVAFPNGVTKNVRVDSLFIRKAA